MNKTGFEDPAKSDPIQLIPKSRKRVHWADTCSNYRAEEKPELEYVKLPPVQNLERRIRKTIEFKENCRHKKGEPTDFDDRDPSVD